MAKKKTRKVNKRARASVIIDQAGRVHQYLNAAYPADREGKEIAPRVDLLCPKCGHGYAALACRPGVCEECRWDRAVEWGLSVQDEIGINLGWRRPDVLRHPELVTRSEVPKKLRVLTPLVKMV